MVTADPAAQRRLLDLQAVDTALAQLSHRRRTLPELATIATAQATLAGLRDDAVSLETEISDIAGEQRRLENDIDVVRQREQRDQQRLLGGGIPAKELEGLQHELGTLARRQGALEDSALEVMEQREALESSLAEVNAQRDTFTRELAAAEHARDAAFAEIDAAIAARQTERASSATGIPEDLIALYDRVRETSGGVGAAALRQRRCEGCRLELAGSELSAVRQAAPDEVVRCENCRRILVRTPESGL